MPTIGQQGLDLLSRYGVVSQGTALPSSGNLGYLRNLLRSEMNRQITNPYASEWRAASQRAITSQTRQALDFLRQQASLSGFRGMVDPNAVANIIEKQSIALQQSERDIQATNLDLMKTQLAYREQAIARLLGLEQFTTQFDAQVGLDLLGKAIGVRENQLGRDLQWRITQEQANAQRQAAIGSIIGGLLGAAGMFGLGTWLKK